MQKILLKCVEKVFEKPTCWLMSLRASHAIDDLPVVIAGVQSGYIYQSSGYTILTWAHRKTLINNVLIQIWEGKREMIYILRTCKSH